MRSRNLKARNSMIHGRVVTQSRKGNKANVERKVGDCWQWWATGQCSKGYSCGFHHGVRASGKGSELHKKERTSSPAPNSKTTLEGKGKSSDKKDEKSVDKKNKIPCQWGNCTNLSCSYRHPPVCQGRKLLFSTCWAGGKAKQEVEERRCEWISCNAEGLGTDELRISRSSSWGKKDKKEPVTRFNSHLAPGITSAPETLTGIRPTTSATSPWGGHSDPLADTTPNKGYEPNLCIDVSSEHTPINYSLRKNNFYLENTLTTTVAESENSDGFPQRSAAPHGWVHLPALGNQREATIQLQVQYPAPGNECEGTILLQVLKSLC